MRLLKIFSINFVVLVLLLLAAEMVWDLTHHYSIFSIAPYRQFHYAIDGSPYEKIRDNLPQKYWIEAHLPDQAKVKIENKEDGSGAQKFSQIKLDKMLPNLYAPTASTLPKGITWISETSLQGSGKVLYSVPQSTDSFGRRTTIQSNEIRNRKLGVSFFGCSFTWGDGLRDSETLASQFAKLSHIETQNYGRNGGNPASTLQIIQDENFAEEWPHKEKIIGIHLMIPDQFYRTIPGIQYSTQFYYQAYFDFSTGVAHRYRNFAEFQPVLSSIYSGLSHSHLLADLGWNVPLSIDNYSLDYNARLLKEVADEFKRRNPNSFFIVVLFPGFKNIFFRYALMQQSVFVLDYSNLDFSPYCRSGCVLNEFDGHPSAEFNAIFAKQILSDLKRRPELSPFLSN